MLTLADARLACRIVTGDTTNDSDLSATYIPAVTVVCEDVAGPIMQATRTWPVDGGKSSILLPAAPASVTSVVESGNTLTQGTDYVVDLKSGIIFRGTIQSPYAFLVGYQNITVTYVAGYAVATANVTPAHKLAARIILRQLWQADQQGTGQGRQINGVGVDQDTVMTPSGFAVPRRAYELLKPTPNLPGFA
jgi:hypothetical protein